MSERIRGRKLQRRNSKLRARDPLCKECREEGVISPAVEWDHTVPLFKGGRDDETNLQGLCRPHHRVKTARDMGHKTTMGGDINGLPLDPNHHWNKT